MKPPAAAVCSTVLGRSRRRVRIVGDEAFDVPDQLAARPRVDQRAVVARRWRQRLPAEAAVRLRRWLR
jgi:hypothetical protein